jgi:hypothetical protein
MQPGEVSGSPAHREVRRAACQVDRLVAGLDIKRDIRVDRIEGGQPWNQPARGKRRRGRQGDGAALLTAQPLDTRGNGVETIAGRLRSASVSSNARTWWLIDVALTDNSSAASLKLCSRAAASKLRKADRDGRRRFMGFTIHDFDSSIC